MGMGIEGMKHREYRVERVEGPDDSNLSFSPERGGIITSLQIKGVELLYMEEATFKDPAKNVRGGIPILFPNSGPIEHELFPGMKQHGFARTLSTWEHSPLKGRPVFAERLTANEETLAQYPYHFSLEVAGSLEDGAFRMYQRATNTDPSDTKTHMPVAMGLHPYFKVPRESREHIVFDFPGGDTVSRDKSVWLGGGTVSIDNPGTSMRVALPGVGTLTLQASPEYKKLWVWSLPDKDFICIEPVMRDEGGLVRDPEYVAPGDSITGRFSISFETA